MVCLKPYINLKRVCRGGVSAAAGRCLSRIYWSGFVRVVGVQIEHGFQSSVVRGLCGSFSDQSLIRTLRFWLLSEAEVWWLRLQDFGQRIQCFGLLIPVES